MITSSKVKKLGGVLFACILIAGVAGCGGSGGSLNESATKTSGSGGNKTGNGNPVTLTNIYSNPKDLGVGDVLFADLNSAASLDFEGVESGAEFAFGMINASADGGNFTVTLSGDLSETEFDLAKASDPYNPDEVLADEPVLTEDFHAFLREQEKEMEGQDHPLFSSFSAGKSAGSGAGVSASVSLGDSQSFKVLASLNSTKEYVTVNATAECIGDNVIFFVDSEVSTSVFSDADIARLCDDFDPVVAEEQNLLGDLPDVDGNGKVIALFTPQVNRLGGQGGGIITGFFLANDLYVSSGSNPASNYAEILYIMVPDPNGSWGATISRDFAMSNLLPSVLPHELQHVINYNEHVLVARGSAENACMNEGLSHLAEDLMGQGQENPSRYGIYLASPQSYSIISCTSAGLGSRGGSYLFLRYLYEQSGKSGAFLQRLIQSPYTGVENLERAFAGSAAGFDQFGEFFLKFAVAITGITADPEFAFQARTEDSVTGQWQGACVDCEADDGRGTVLGGVSTSTYRGYQIAATRPAAVRYFKIANMDDELKFNSPTGGEGYGVLIRTK